MGKKSRRFNREAQKEKYRQQKKALKELRENQAEQGIEPIQRPTINNSKSKLRTKDEEKSDRQSVVEEKIAVYRSQLPIILKKLSKIKDPRNPKKSKHKLTVVLLYGILLFVFQMSSRRESTREMTRPAFMEALQEIFPELETIPHHDTLNRILSKIDVNRIETVMVEIVRKLIRNKKFARYLLKKHYMIAIDGTQKFNRDYAWADECLTKDYSKGDKENINYQVYVLEANIVFNNGITIPLFTEFLDNEEDKKSGDKQDCELVAFRRLSKRIKDTFKRLPIMLLLDGLYANGPLIEICRKYHWQFMIVLQDKSLKTVWENIYAIKKIDGHEQKEQYYGDRKQNFWWVNDVEYRYGDNLKKKQTLHVVVCEESWEDIDKNTLEVIEKGSKHAWISSEAVSQKNVHQLCNLAGRYRWSIENGILVEKHQGYSCTHCFSYDWNAMKGFHYLMRIAHLLNVLAQNTIYLADKVKQMGKRGLIKYIKETMAGNWLDYDRIRIIVNSKPQLRLI